MTVTLPLIAVPRPASCNFDAAFSAMPQAAMLVGDDGIVQYANLSAIKLFEPNDPVGSAIEDLFFAHRLNGPAPSSAFNLLEARRIRLADGRTLDCIAAPLENGSFAVTMNDVTAYLHDAERALLDPLTGLPNRALFRQHLATLLPDRRNAVGSLAVLCIDLDRFKPVNDTLGHPIGDLLLQKVAQRLRSAVREGDLVARLGGDEFAIVQMNVGDPCAVEALAARVVDLLGRTYVIDGFMLNIGASVGVSLAPGDGIEPDQLIKQADLALYRAKTDGRGTFRFFEQAMDARMQARRVLEIDLRRALAMKEFSLAYQPQVTIGTGTVTGFEALLRWKQPERGMVSPADFIPLAEEIGMINQIGEWVLRTACCEAAGWSRPLSVAVNISPVQFRAGKLVELTMSALAHSGLDPSRLELEITEGTLLENTSNVLGTLNRLREIGIRISMDDFGTGYSSLSYLQKFPFSKIKIDQAFVRGSNADASSMAIVRAISGLGVSLGMKTIAEGVETQEQLVRIEAAGCGEVQGYLTGRPMAANAIEDFLHVNDSQAT